MDTQQLWQAVLGELELTLTKAHFITWFKDTFVSDSNNDQVVIGVPNTFTKAWLERKYHDKLVTILRTLTKNDKLKVFYTVESSKNMLHKQLLNIVNKDITQEEPPANTMEKNPNYNGLNVKYLLENYVVGKGNELAHAACQAVVANPGKTYNPLFIYGGVGLGKTHLMQGIGNAILKSNPKLKVLYTSCEAFTNEFIQSIKEGKMAIFTEKFRTVDILMVDDIQFISGKDQTQEQFFHTFNELHQQNKQIVIASDRPPKAIHTLDNRLQSRLEWGMIADIMNPDYETRVAILQSKCKERNYNLDASIVAYIAENIHSNVRELEGALNKIMAIHHLNNTTPTVESVKSILGTIAANMQKQVLTPKTIIDLIVEFFDIRPEDLLGSSREKKLVIPRQITMFLMREELKSSFPAIGQEIGGRDHTTAMHAYEKIKREVKRDDKIRQNIELIRQKLYVA